MKKQETQIQNAVRQYLTVKGWYVMRIQQGLGCHKGISDLIAIKDGEVVFIEIKSPNGVLSENQKRFSDAITSQKGRYIVIRSINEAMEIF